MLCNTLKARLLLINPAGPATPGADRRLGEGDHLFSRIIKHAKQCKSSAVEPDSAIYSRSYAYYAIAIAPPASQQLKGVAEVFATRNFASLVVAEDKADSGDGGNDEELARLMKDTTIAAGGVLPNIHVFLLPRKAKDAAPE